MSKLAPVSAFSSTWLNRQHIPIDHSPCAFSTHSARISLAARVSVAVLGVATTAAR